MGAAQCEHIFQHRLLEQQGALLKGTLRKGEDGTSERRPRVSIHHPCWLTSSWDSNQKPSNHDFPQPLPQATVSLRGCVTRGSWKSAYGPEKKKKKCWLSAQLRNLNKCELQCWAGPAVTIHLMRLGGHGDKLCSWCSCAPCDSRLIPDQLLMVPIVNKQVNGDSQQISDLPGDGWTAVFPCFLKGLVLALIVCTHDHTHTHAVAHIWRHEAGGLTSVALTRTCHHLALHSCNQQACQQLSVTDSSPHNDVCVCVCVCMCVCVCVSVCVSWLICSPAPSYTTEAPMYLHSCLPLSLRRVGDTCVGVCVPCWALQHHVSPQTVRWGAERTIEATVILCRRKRWEDDGKRRRQWEWKWGRGRRSDSWRRIDKESRGWGGMGGGAFQTRWQSWRDFSEPGLGAWPTPPKLQRRRNVKGTQRQTSKRLPGQALL